jgi:hypothetical protein
MRRAVVILLGALALLLVALPAVATEDAESTDPATEAGEPFGEGQWDGLLAAGAVAAVFGLIVFALSNIGVKDEPAADAHH